MAKHKKPTTFELLNHNSAKILYLGGKFTQGIALAGVSISLFETEANFVLHEPLGQHVGQLIGYLALGVAGGVLSEPGAQLLDTKMQSHFESKESL